MYSAGYASIIDFRMDSVRQNVWDIKILTFAPCSRYLPAGTASSLRALDRRCVHKLLPVSDGMYCSGIKQIPHVHGGYHTFITEIFHFIFGNSHGICRKEHTPLQVRQAKHEYTVRITQGLESGYAYAAITHNLSPTIIEGVH
jgi:hypothetical protein